MGCRPRAGIRDVHGVMEAQRQPEVLEAHRRAGLVACDGMPMVWASRWAGVRTAERVYGPDFMLAMCARAEVEGWKSFFYGGNEGVAERLSIRLREQLHFNSNANATTSTFRTSNSPHDIDRARYLASFQPATRLPPKKPTAPIRLPRQGPRPPSPRPRPGRPARGGRSSSRQHRHGLHRRPRTGRLSWP